MKHLFTALVVLILAFPAFAQEAPLVRADRAEPAPANPQLALAEKNVRQYGVQLNRFRETVGQKDLQTSQAFYVSILQTIRATITDADLVIPAPAAGIPESEYTESQTRLFRQKRILDSFEGFNIDFSKPAELEEKMTLLMEYQKLIQDNLTVMRSK